MFWTNTGERAADCTINDAMKTKGCKNRRGKQSQTVIPVNALMGACLVQGVLLGRLLHGCRRFDAPITEVYPGALLCLLGKCRHRLNELVPDAKKISCSVCNHDEDKSRQATGKLPCYICRQIQAKLERNEDVKPCPAEDKEDALLARIRSLVHARAIAVKRNVIGNGGISCRRNAITFYHLVRP